MKISLNWLKDYIKSGVTKDTLTHKLTMAGLEVENVSVVDGDTVIELEITPNRADCLSLVGVAREISAVLNKPLIEPKIKSIKYPANKLSVVIQDTKDCQIYTGTLFENVSVTDSPDWIKGRISSLGIRPVSNLVDITNFCLMEYGQPLHVFDFDKLDGGSIQVRRAKKGEKIITIDGVERELDPSILVIADAKKPVAIAGIMGGASTEVTSSTKNVLLESAYFDPILTRRASRKLGLSSDSCYRFERGVDLAGVTKVSHRAANLILEISGGKITKYGKSGTTAVRKQKAISLTLERINSYLGTQIPLTTVKKIMVLLNFSVTVVKGKLNVISPSSRSDIKSDVDIIEEVARIVGYDNLPETIPNIKISNIEINIRRKTRDRIRECMLTQGFDEAVSFSLINKSDLIKSKLETEKIAFITNPLSLDQEILQPSTLPSLLAIVKTNINRGQKNIKMFELSKIYLQNGDELETLSIIMTGSQRNDWRDLDKRPLDIYDLKGAVGKLFEIIGIKNIQYVLKKDSTLKVDKSIVIGNGQKEIGIMGEVDNTILQNWGIKKENILFAQIIIPYQNALDLKDRKYVPFSNFPAVYRDVSLSVDQSINFQTIKDLVLKEGGALLKNIEFVELYLGEKIAEGMKGIIFSLMYQSDERTLTEAEVNEVHQRILSKLTVELKSSIR